MAQSQSGKQSSPKTTMKQAGQSKTYQDVLGIRNKINDELKTLQKRLAKEQIDLTAAEASKNLYQAQLDKLEVILNDAKDIYKDSSTSRLNLVLVFIWSRYLEVAKFQSRDVVLEKEFKRELDLLKQAVEERSKSSGNEEAKQSLMRKYGLEPDLNNSLLYEYAQEHASAKAALAKVICGDFPSDVEEFNLAMRALKIQFPQKYANLREQYALDVLIANIEFSSEAQHLWKELRRDNNLLQTGLDDCLENYQTGLRDSIQTSYNMGVSAAKIKAFQVYMAKEAVVDAANPDLDFPVPASVTAAVDAAEVGADTALPQTQNAVDDMLKVLPQLHEVISQVEGMKFYSMGCILMVSSVLLAARENYNGTNRAYKQLQNRLAGATVHYETVLQTVSLLNSLVDSAKASETAAQTALGQLA